MHMYSYATVDSACSILYSTSVKGGTTTCSGEGDKFRAHRELVPRAHSPLHVVETGLPHSSQRWGVQDGQRVSSKSVRLCSRVGHLDGSRDVNHDTDQPQCGCTVIRN